MLSLVLIPGEGSGQFREPKTVRAAILGGQVPLPIAIGLAQGFFEKFGVRVTTETMWTSQELREGLAAGKYDVAHAVVDNSVATAETIGVPTIIVLGGETSSANELVAQPHIKTQEELRGATLLVDSLDTAFALQLRKILRLKGLEAGRDYTLKPLGQTLMRFEAMKINKEYAATMMPLTAEARRLGFHSLGSVAKLIGPYQGGGVFATKRWVEANPDGTVAYLAGYLHTLRWMRDSANRAEVIEQLAKASDPESARQVYARSIAEGTLARDPRFDVEAFKNVLVLRAEIEGTWGGKPPAPERYYDLSYFQKALALLDK
jgi:ABC-type nitrate/sulfonate/bicarbonate transport system substrate-binding protein